MTDTPQADKSEPKKFTEPEAKDFLNQLIKAHDFYIKNYSIIDKKNNQKGNQSNSIELETNNDTDAKKLFWENLLTKPESSIDEIRNMQGINVGQTTGENYAKKLYSMIKDLLQVITLQEVKVQRDKFTINGRIINKTKGYGVITAANKLREEELFRSINDSKLLKEFIDSPVINFHRDANWRDFIRRTCSKLRLIGFQKYNYPFIDNFYIEPNFSFHNSEKSKIEEKGFCEFATIIDKASSAFIVVKSQSGYGKTSLLKYLSILCYKQQIKNNCLPVYISLKQSLFQDDDSEGIFESYLLTLVEQGFKMAKEDISKIFEDGKAFILVDGLNNSYYNASRHFVLVEKLIKRFPKNVYVVSYTSSPDGDTKAEEQLLDTLKEVFIDSLFLTTNNNKILTATFNLQKFEGDKAQEFINRYFNEFEQSNSREVPNEDEIKKLFSSHPHLLESPLLLSCYCFCRTKFTSPELIEDLSILVIKELTKQWDFTDNQIPNIANPYFHLKDLRIQFLGFLAAQFMLGDDELDNQAGVAVKQATVEKWIVKEINNPESFLDTSPLNVMNMFRDIFQQTCQTLKNKYDGELENNSVDQILAAQILESIKRQHGLIVERGSDLAFIHAIIQKSLIINYLQDQSNSITDKYRSLGGDDWTKILKKVEEKKQERTISLSRLEQIQLQILRELKNNGVSEKDPKYQSVEQALTNVIQSASLS